MHVVLTRIILLGRGDFFEASKRHAQQNSRLSIADLAIAVLVFVALVAFLFFLSKIFSPREKPRGVNSPLRLFWTLCQAHGLKLSQCWLLWRVAREHQLKDPALLFVEPELLDVDMLGAGFAPHAAVVESLHGLLFEGVVGDTAGR